MDIEREPDGYPIGELQRRRRGLCVGGDRGFSRSHLTRQTGLIPARTRACTRCQRAISTRLRARGTGGVRRLARIIPTLQTTVARTTLPTVAHFVPNHGGT